MRTVQLCDCIYQEISKTTIALLLNRDMTLNAILHSNCRMAKTHWAT
jgi:hypothetical protein